MIAFLFVFESSVNSEGIETKITPPFILFGFESSVNSEGIETKNPLDVLARRLRAV